MMIIKKVGIIGLGLIGGSLARAIREKNIAEEIIAIDSNQETLALALKEGIIDKASIAVSSGLTSVDLLFCCLPARDIINLIPLLEKYISKQTLISDVASTKEEIVLAFKKTSLSFIGSHPLSGSEKNGFLHATSNLFQGSICLITPFKGDFKGKVDFIRLFWENIGCSVRCITASQHDQIMAYTSHLPHLIATLLVNSLQENMLSFTSKGYWDTTRIASGSVNLWQGIFESNRSYLLESIHVFEEELKKAKEYIESNNKDKLGSFLDKAKTRRDKHI